MTLEEHWSKLHEHEDEHDAAGDPSTAAAAAAAAAAGDSTVSFTGVRGRFGFKRNPSARYMKLPFINGLNKGKYVIAAHERAARDNTSHFRDAAARQARTSQNVIFVCQTHGMYQANYGLERGKKDLKKLSKRLLEDLPKPVESINVCGGGGCCTLVNKWDEADLEELAEMAPVVKWKRGDDGKIVKVTKQGQWIVQNSPIGYLGISTSREGAFANKIGTQFQATREILASNDPGRLFSLIELTNRPIEADSMFIPPGSVYADKEHIPYDDTTPDGEESWAMILLPIFQPLDVKSLEAALGFKFLYNDGEDGYPNRTHAEQLNRIINNRLLTHDAFWVRGPTNIYWPDGVREPPNMLTAAELRTLKKRYESVTGLWNNAARDSTMVKLSDMLGILKEGTFISLTCSPPGQTIQGSEVFAENQLATAAFDEYLKELAKVSGEEWKSIFDTGYTTRPRGKNYGKPQRLMVEFDTVEQWKRSKREHATRAQENRSQKEWDWICPCAQ